MLFSWRSGAAQTAAPTPNSSLGPPKSLPHGKSSVPLSARAEHFSSRSVLFFFLFKTALNGTRFLIYQSHKDAKENKTRLSKGNLSMQTVSNQNVFGTLSEPFISDITIVSHHPSHPPL